VGRTTYHSSSQQLPARLNGSVREEREAWRSVFSLLQRVYVENLTIKTKGQRTRTVCKRRKYRTF